MGNLFTTISDEERDLQIQSNRARQLQRDIQYIEYTITDQTVKGERILNLITQYLNNVNDARKRQTSQICEQVSKFAYKLKTELIPKDETKSIDIRFDGNGQIVSIENGTDSNYKVDNETLHYNQIPNNQLTYLYLNNKENNYIGFGKPFDNYSEDLYQINCDPNDNCTCTFQTREKSVYNPPPVLKSATKLG